MWMVSSSDMKNEQCCQKFPEKANGCFPSISRSPIDIWWNCATLQQAKKRMEESTMRKVRLLMLLLLITGANLALGQDSLRWNIEGGFTYRAFQQQVKAEVGDPRGERLVNETEFGLLFMGSYRVWEVAQVGLFAQFDRGNRHAARFSGFDPATGRTVTKDKIGGNYHEFWLGPFVRLRWKTLTGEAGWAVTGFRSDDARTDLVSSSGDSTGTFDLLPSVAFFSALGAVVPLHDEISLVVRFEYRLRYYKGREGKLFRDNVEHGTQNISPFIGLSWRF
jgi:hypothetical protein